MSAANSTVSSSSFRPLEPLLEAELEATIAFRHDLHRHPELGYAETRTAARVVAALRDVPGLDIREGVGGTGVVATLGGGLPGPAVALRADLDALPIEETSGVAHASTVPGRMHACGHDGHTAMLVAAARILGQLPQELAGPVRFIFQPAEEGGRGAERMIAEGALENPSMAAIFGLHNYPGTEAQAGQFCLCPGAAMAGTATFDIVVKGRGGHAATPHKTVDPIFLGSQIISALQGIVSRSTDPIAPAVLSITRFHAGSAYNVIPSEARIGGTIRSLDEGVMGWMKTQLARQARQIAEALGGEAEVNLPEGYPVTRNHPETDAVFCEVVRAIGRQSDYLEIAPTMGGEDFAFYQERIPGTFWFLASRPPEKSSVPFWHHADFDFNDAVLADGIRLHVEIARRFAHLHRG